MGRKDNNLKEKLHKTEIKQAEKLTSILKSYGITLKHGEPRLLTEENDIKLILNALK